MQVNSGIIHVSPSTATTPGRGGPNKPEEFEFLSATFGATLPRGDAFVVPSFPEDACTPLENSVRISSTSSLKGAGAAVLVRRGGCSFGIKSKHAQVILVSRAKTLEVSAASQDAASVSHTLCVWRRLLYAFARKNEFLCATFGLVKPTKCAVFDCPGCSLDPWQIAFGVSTKGCRLAAHIVFSKMQSGRATKGLPLRP